MSKPAFIELTNGARLAILYEDPAVLAIDKPAGWMLVPTSWQQTPYNLQAALNSSLATRPFWARCRNVKFLRYVHRLDAETSGILLLAKSRGALDTLSRLFESRSIQKTYLAVVSGAPAQPVWTCSLKLGRDPHRIGRMRPDPRTGKPAETRFRVLASRGEGRHPIQTLIEACPITGRTHQIRVHLAAAGLPVVGDSLYGKDERPPREHSPATGARSSGKDPGLALRAVALAYQDPFGRGRVAITAPRAEFLSQFGFASLGRVPSPALAIETSALAGTEVSSRE